MIRALWFREYREFQKKAHPGSLFFHKADRDGMVKMDFFCPCGCKARDVLHLFGKDTAAPTWNGSFTEPTTSLLITRTCGWRGVLKNGYWDAE